jgi:hypothetical protein
VEFSGGEYLTDLRPQINVGISDSAVRVRRTFGRVGRETPQKLIPYNKAFKIDSDCAAIRKPSQDDFPKKAKIEVRQAKENWAMSGTRVVKISTRLTFV